MASPVIAFSDCKGPSAQPEVLKPHRLQAFKVCWCKCTRGAKGRLEKSITYKANLASMCKCLQENIQICRHAAPVSICPKTALTGHNPLIVKDKTHFILKASFLRGSKPLVPQLHSFWVTRGGSQGSC